MTTNIFEIATRNKLRFSSAKGMLTIEDLWDLSLTNLDKIAVELYEALNNSNTVKSFINANLSQKDELISVAFDVVKHIINTKLTEKQVAADAKDLAEKRRRLVDALARKEDQAIDAMSVAELQEQIKALG